MSDGDGDLERSLLAVDGHSSVNATPTEEKTPKTEAATAYEELQALLTLSWPVALASLFRVALWSTDTAFLGHLGTDELTAGGLAYSWMEFLGVFVWSSAYALNSVCAQAIGANNPKLAGNWLQLALAFVSLLSVPVIGAHFLTGRVLTLIYGPAKIARAVRFSQTINNFASLAFWPTVVYMALRQYFQAMEVVKPATLVSGLSVGVNIGLNQLLIWGVGAWHGLGLKGSPLATFASTLFQLCAFYVFAIVVKKYHEPYWGGWTTESFRADRVVRFLKVVGPMTVGACFESWGYTVITLSSGKLGSAQASAMQVLYAIWGVLWIFYWVSGLPVNTVARTCMIFFSY